MRTGARQPNDPPPLAPARAGALTGLAVLALTGLTAPLWAGPDTQPAYIAPLATQALLLDAATSDGLITVVGERGIALRSIDAGVTWSQSEVPLRATLTGVYFHDAQLGWAVGHDTTILRTRDGGASWQVLNYEPEAETPLLDVWFADADNGMAIGSYGYFMVTSDGGDSWERRDFTAEEFGAEAGGESEDDLDASELDEDDLWDDMGGVLDFHLNHLSVTPGGRLYIAAEAGNIFRSDDGGTTWWSMPSPYDGSFFGSLVLGEDSLLVFGMRGNMYRSDDAGESWQSVDVATVALLTDGITLADGRIIVVGLTGAALESDDGARSFSVHSQSDRLGLNAVLAAGDSGMVVVGEGGVRHMDLASMRRGGQ